MKMNLTGLLTALTLSGALAACPLFAFTTRQDCANSIHDQIIHDALGNLFTPANLSIITRSCDSQDKVESEEASDRKRHFQGDDFRKSFAFMDRQKKLALDYAATADSNEKDRARALYHLGLVLHTAEDFYSETNYLETAIARIKRSGRLPDPYDIEPVDWTKLSADWGSLEHGAEISKANGDTAEGKMLIGDVTYFAAAKELAVKESLRQWNILETLIKVRYPQRATTILTALTQASCSPKLDIDKLADDTP